VPRLSEQRALLRFGLRVREERERAGLTQEEFAERVDLSPRNVQRVESGEANISMRTLFAISFALDVEPAELLSAPASKTRRRMPGRPPGT
jgi:transcriptional regulator with XRE-family HTH domain